MIALDELYRQIGEYASTADHVADAVIVYAVARGDMRRVQDFGVTIPIGLVTKTEM